jgi:hypothetical protein
MKKNTDIMIDGILFTVISFEPKVEIDLWEDIENEICAKSTQQS